MNRKALLLSCAVGAVGLLGGVAQAATPASSTSAQDTNQGTTVGELVITAEKREQTLQTVPVAVSAYTSAKRQLIGIDSIQDMSNFTPGLEYNTSTDRISLRGVGRLTNVLSADASVANYFDGIFQSFAVQAGISSIFVDRVEILRGPQGTLYGRNAIAGALNIISRRPTKDWYAEARATYANYNRFLLEGAVSGPITDWLQFRAAGNWEKQTDGWIKEVVPGVSSEGNVIDQVNVDLQLQAQLGPKVDLWLREFFQEWNNPAGGPGSQAGGWTPYPFDQAENGPSSIQLNSGYACNPAGIANGITNVVNPSPLGCHNPAEQSPWLAARNEAWRVFLPDAFTTDFQAVYHAPGFDVKYITGGVHYIYYLYGPADDNLGNNFSAPVTSYTLPGAYGLPGLVINPLDVFQYSQGENTWSHEINFISTTNSPFQWLFGGYYFYQNYTQNVYTVQPNQPQWNGPFGLPSVFCAQTGGVCAPSTDNRPYDNRPRLSDSSGAAFGQIDWKFQPTLKATAGIRYSTDAKYGTESVRLLCFGVPACYTQPEFSSVIGGLPAVDLTQLPTVVANQPAPGVVGPTTYNPETGFATRTYNAHWQAVTGTAGIEWTPDSDTLLYAKYSRGYKSGGFNIGIFTVISFYPYTAAEHVNSYEIGVKKTWFGNLTTDLAAFYYGYQNLQIPITVDATAGGITQSETGFYNVPDSVSEGVELETTWQPNKNITLLFDYSYLNAYVTQGAAVDTVDPDALQPGAKPLPCSAQYPCTPDIYTGGIQRYQNLSGSKLPNAPENKIALNGTYTFFFQPGTLSLSGTFVWRDTQYGTLFSRWYNASPAWDQVDARLTWTAASGKYKVIVYGKNIFQTIGYDAGAVGTRMAGSYDGPPYTFPYAGTVNYLQNPSIDKTYSVTPPRTYGIEFDYKFF